jgi:hypothetical protein
VDADEAEQHFLRGQQALGQGDVFRALSDTAAAARRLPGHPDYEAYASWVRLLADEARGHERKGLAERERSSAEAALLGRRPWPRALYVLGLIAGASGDAAPPPCISAKPWPATTARRRPPGAGARRRSLARRGGEEAPRHRALVSDHQVYSERAHDASGGRRSHRRLGMNLWCRWRWCRAWSPGAF